MQRGTKFASDEYKQQIRTYHQSSDRHVLTVETTLTHQDKCKIFHYADLIRKAGNELVAVMKRNYEQLVRTKKYRKLKILYGKAASLKDKVQLKNLAEQMNEMQVQFNVTWDYCRKKMILIRKKYGIDSVFGLTKAEDIWRAVEKCLYSDGKTLHFSKRGDLPCIRAKEIKRGIILSLNDGKLSFKLHKITFGINVIDRFEHDEVSAIVRYLSQSEFFDNQAVQAMKEQGICISTYRPCYVSLVCKQIRGILRVYANITIEGVAFPKYDKNGNVKHLYGYGPIGCDIGTQTIAYTSCSKVGLKNLAERGLSISTSERNERLIYRALDRSRRILNPQNYNPDGTVKKGEKHWRYSKRYKKLKERHRNLCRKNAINRKLAINEDVNYLRSLGDVFVTETSNAKKLQRRAKETTKNAKGKYVRKKRFGKSIKNRCPGYFQAQIKTKFSRTGGKYLEAPSNYRASQYDHTLDDYVKKKLSERMFKLHNGLIVQRDWYSSFLLYCMDVTSNTIDKGRCNTEFEAQYQKEVFMIQEIRRKKIKIMNSGIKIA